MIYPTAALMLFAFVALELARGGRASPWHSSAAGAAMFLGLIVFRFGLRRALADATSRGRGVTSAAVGVVVAATLAACAATGALAGEAVVLAALLGLGVFLFTCGGDASSLRRSALLAAVVVLFALPGVDAECRLPLIVASAVAGSAWLMATANPSGGRATWAYGASIAASIAGVCVLAHAHVGPDHENPWYAAWVPTSGGDGAGDERARRGTGDGSDEVSGKSADSVGFDRGETFSESGRDGLYDLWVESYGAAAKPSEQQKMIGLKPKDVTLVQADGRENLKVGRSFEMRREPRPSTPRGRADSAAAARMWIKGPLPAYVPLATFHAFDGQAWHEVPHGKPSVPARKLDGSTWMEILHRPISPAFDGTLSHEVRVGDLGGVVLPLPPIVERFKMGRVGRPDFFATTRGGFVRLANRTLPAGATFEVVTKRVVPSRLIAVEPALPKHSDPGVLSTVAVDDRTRALAVSWGAGRPRGWRQIEQVVARLRGHATLDRAASSSVDEVLFGQRGGPDYAIASAAVLLLRSLDYPTRLVSGLYADPANVEARSGFVALDAADAHFWIEVRLADGTWVTVDPSPGYPMLNLPLSPGEWLAGVWGDARRVVSTHAVGIGLAVAVGGTLLALRRPIIDRAATALCRLRGCEPTRVLRVIELRARLLGRPRPPSMPVGAWVRSLGGGDVVFGFARELNRALYDERAAPTTTGRAALQEMTLSALKYHQPGTT